ncbi:cytochrome c3 family protein [Thermosulfuriphilus sp.]
MKSHVLRPLFVAIGLGVLLIIVRSFLTPSDFGIHGQSFTYSYFRLSNIDEWKAFTVKYQGQNYCAECHPDNYEEHENSKHRIIQCENCHGPAINHPDDPEALPIDRSRALCLRCHAALPYPQNPRSKIPGIDPQEHNPEATCSECHNPHNPNLEE